MTANENIGGGGPKDKTTKLETPPEKKSGKIGSDVAEQEFNRFVDLMNLDVEDEYLNDEDKAGLATNRHRFLRAVEAGSLTVDGDGVPTFTPQKSDNCEPIIFYEPTGASLMAMDRKKEGADVGKMFTIMADFTKTDQNRFAKLKVGDLNVCMAVAMLYLG